MNTVSLMSDCMNNNKGYPMLFQCWANVFNAGPTLKQHWVDTSCLLGYSHLLSPQRNIIIMLYNYPSIHDTPTNCWLNVGSVYLNGTRIPMGW